MHGRYSDKSNGKSKIADQMPALPGLASHNQNETTIATR
jgi:hypothetical protein